MGQANWLVLGLISMAAVAPAQGAARVETLLQAELPAWARDGLYNGVYLDIDRVMKEEMLSRFGAIELQNQFKDLLDTGTARQEAYDRALAAVKQGAFESGWKPVSFAQPGDYVAVLDLDETLLHQWFASSARGNFDLEGLFRDDNGGVLRSPDKVKFTPRAEEFVRALERDPHSRGVVIFSAKLDAAANDLLAKWKFSDGTLARSHFAGLFTRNHLVIGAKAWAPSKDLRIFDPELKHVVMVDDNPSRIVQAQVLRAQPKFDADAHLRARNEGDAEIVQHYNTLLSTALSEIDESARAADRLMIPFSQAFLPYSYSGTRVYQSLVSALGDSRRALEATRKNPALQEAAFFSPAQ